MLKILFSLYTKTGGDICSRRVMRCGFADECTHRYLSCGTNQSTASAIRFLCAIIGTLRCSLMTNQCLLWVFSRQSKCNRSRQDPFSLHWSSFWILPSGADQRDGIAYSSALGWQFFCGHNISSLGFCAQCTPF